jgi:NRPS condensation-like uncharacterized protein
MALLAHSKYWAITYQSSRTSMALNLNNDQPVQLRQNSSNLCSRSNFSGVSVCRVNQSHMDKMQLTIDTVKDQLEVVQ